jgi:hypothetical protein
VKIWTLLETDIDTIAPSVGVYRSYDEAYKVALTDIEANGNRLIDEDREPGRTTIYHENEQLGEFVTVIQEHEV